MEQEGRERNEKEEKMRNETYGGRIEGGKGLETTRRGRSERDRSKRSKREQVKGKEDDKPEGWEEKGE